ncbi:MAG: IMP cyclohydrolase [Lentisphaerae bacterium]|nr:IMP cyclohydrolase [Lentisphaerota bacterium]MCP4101223.1 IMP cyclohydrolase [Lentisphaerota bacterium]
MYLGRIVAIGMNNSGKAAAMYRVSSRSFPNRETRKQGETVSVMPRAGFEDDLKKSPYIAYNCVRIARDFAIVSNGSHTDPIAEKIAMGLPPRDALALSLLAMDYEKDDYDTPRIAAVIQQNSNEAYLGIVRKDAVMVRAFKLEPGKAYYLSTYEKNTPQDENIDTAFDAENADAACTYSIKGGAFADFEHPVTAAAVIADADTFDIATEVV